MSQSPNDHLCKLIAPFGPKLNFSNNNSPRRPSKNLTKLSGLIIPGLTTSRHYKENLSNLNVNRPQVTILCSICLDSYRSDLKSKRPRCLPYCGHVLCVECLLQILSNSKEAIICHICKQSNSLSAHPTINLFPISWPILESLKTTNTKLFSSCKSSLKGEYCNHCNNKEASYWCTHHAIKLCADCALKHSKECIDKKIIEANSVKTYLNDINKNYKQFLDQINLRIEEAMKIKEDFYENIGKKFDELIHSINRIKKNTIKNIDFYIFQLNCLQKELDKKVIKIEDMNSIQDENQLKSLIRKISSFEDIIKKKEKHCLERFSLEINFNDDTLKSINAFIGKICESKIQSPYLPSQNSTIEEALFNACENSDEYTMDYIMKNFDIDINKRNNVGMTPFCIAVSKNDSKLYKKLHEKYKANPNISDNAGKSPLLYACIKNYEEAASYLIRTCKVDTNITNKWKDTPLHYAAEVGNYNIVKLLIIEGKADAKIVNERGKMAVDITNNKKIKEFLLGM